MNRVVWIVLVLTAAVIGFSAGASSAHAQFGTLVPTDHFDLSATVELNRAAGATLAHLQRARAYLADRQWDEAIETLLQVMAGAEDEVIGVTQRRYVNLRDYCHLQFAALPAEGLRRYRELTDASARQWYEDGMARRDRRLLRNVVDQAFAGSFGDDALLALGEMALERGDATLARWHWERIIPADLPDDRPRTWPGYPDTDLDLAAVRARLVLVSILEGDRSRARDDLAELKRQHADARGRLAGRDDVNYVETLATLLAGSATWPDTHAHVDWPTFAGDPTRNHTAPKLTDVGQVAWRIPIQPIEPEKGTPPSAYPVVIGDLVLVNNAREIMAVRLDSGKPAWETADDTPTFYRIGLNVPVASLFMRSNTLGTPRHTMTVTGGKLFARMGNSWTGRPQQRTDSSSPGYLVTLDLAVQGRLLGSKEKISPAPGFSMEGSPVSDGTHVYVAMRRDDMRPQAHVACFDARTGRRLWRRFICGADSPAQGAMYRNTHGLLTLVGETLYYNTNLGAVAAVSIHDGRLLWVSLYPRVSDGNIGTLATHWNRDPSPCLFHRGMLLVAPADSPRIFAFDAATGQMLGQSGTQIGDVSHLLGTTDDHLIAAGGRVYWIGLKGERQGRIHHVWPVGPKLAPFGRGLIAGDEVLWPTEKKIYTFDRKTAEPKKVIDLAARGARGGNLVVAGDGRLLIATPDELIAMRRFGGPPTTGGEGIAKAPPRAVSPRLGSVTGADVSVRLEAGP